MIASVTWLKVVAVAALWTMALIAGCVGLVIAVVESEDWDELVIGGVLVFVAVCAAITGGLLL